jgi:hypothetical protein
LDAGGDFGDSDSGSEGNTRETLGDLKRPADGSDDNTGTATATGSTGATGSGFSGISGSSGISGISGFSGNGVPLKRGALLGRRVRARVTRAIKFAVFADIVEIIDDAAESPTEESEFLPCGTENTAKEEGRAPETVGEIGASTAEKIGEKGEIVAKSRAGDAQNFGLSVLFVAVAAIYTYFFY